MENLLASQWQQLKWNCQKLDEADVEKDNRSTIDDPSKWENLCVEFTASRINFMFGWGPKGHECTGGRVCGCDEA